MCKVSGYLIDTLSFKSWLGRPWRGKKINNIRCKLDKLFILSIRDYDRHAKKTNCRQTNKQVIQFFFVQRPSLAHAIKYNWRRHHFWFQFASRLIRKHSANEAYLTLLDQLTKQFSYRDRYPAELTDYDTPPPLTVTNFSFESKIWMRPVHVLPEEDE